MIQIISARSRNIGGFPVIGKGRRRKIRTHRRNADYLGITAGEAAKTERIVTRGNDRNTAVERAPPDEVY